MKLWNVQKRAAVFLAALLAALFCMPVQVFAELDGDGAFQNTHWQLLFEDDIQTPLGIVQSMTVTEDYIITIENTTDHADLPDVVSAYYRNSTDAEGNPVEQYSLANRVENYNWEHGNGMTYNPNTGKIYVSFYTSLYGEGSHAGCIQEMNPETLEPGDLIQIGDGSYNILGIAYNEETDQYVIQTNGDGGFSIKLLDSDFQIIDDFGAMDPSPGKNFQDMEVDGDYVMVFLMTQGMGIGEWLNVFSLSQRSFVLNTMISLEGMSEFQTTETEGMAKIGPGQFLAIVTAKDASGSRKVRFYETEVPYITPTPSPTPTEAETPTPLETPIETPTPATITEATESPGRSGSAFDFLSQKAGASALLLLPILFGAGFLYQWIRIVEARKRVNERIRRRRIALKKSIEADFLLSESTETWFDQKK